MSDISTADIQSWLIRSADEPYVYLTTTGRRSGRRHRIEIWFAVHDGRIYLMSGGRDRSDWVRNIRANPNVTVELAGRSHDGIAKFIGADDPEDQLARELLVTKYARPGNELTDWGRNSLPLVIDLSQDVNSSTTQGA